MPIGPMVVPPMDNLSQKQRKYMWIAVGVIIAILVVVSIVLYVSGHQAEATGATGAAAVVAAAASKLQRDSAAQQLITEQKNAAVVAEVAKQKAASVSLAVGSVETGVQLASDAEIQAEGERLFGEHK